MFGFAFWAWIQWQEWRDLQAQLLQADTDGMIDRRQ